MGFSIREFHHQNRSWIIGEWVERLHTEVGEQYARRPVEELEGTISEAFEANFHVVVNQDFSYINEFIDKITKMRLEAGFLLSDVQKAFELYRIIVTPLLASETSSQEFSENIVKINQCLAYTIHRFSDHFQNMHEEEILKHNRRLEEDVRVRTAELRESQLKYKTLVEEITDGYFVIQNEVVVFANNAYCEMHGFTLEEVLGKMFHAFVAPDSRDKVIEIYQKSLRRTPSPRSFEYMRLTKDGRSFPTEILARVTRYDNKLSSIGICRDITERVKMEQRVRETERMAYIGQITTSLSHEIRNPLSTVKMNLQILTKNRQIQGNDQRRIEMSSREVVRLEGILKELLDFAKPLQLNLRPTDINQVLSSCAELLDMKFKEKNLIVHRAFDLNMPLVRADMGKLEQAFINMLLNAVETSDYYGEILIKTAFRADGVAEGAEVSIQDFGQGIPRESRDELFKPFFTTKTKGTGLGLSNVKRIVEAHGGCVKAENGRPRGACFNIFLPAGADHGQNSHHR